MLKLSQHAHFLELGVIRTFEFMSALRRMSVVIKRLKSSSMEIYAKGAPEVMGEICNKESCTLAIYPLYAPTEWRFQSLATTMTCSPTTQSEDIVS